MNKIITLLFVVSLSCGAVSQENMSYFLPDDLSYNKEIPTPEEFFSQQIGEWHLTHDQVLSYMQEIARISDRAVMEEYARSYENRPLVHLIFTSAENHGRLGDLKTLHLKHANPHENIDQSTVPLVIILGYGIHGNESSATNASVLTAYYLAAAQGDKIEQLLKNSIVLVDPCLNPDGFTRHSTWANMHQSHIPNGDDNSRQFSEVWPGGRGNHYWFDLNRDYLLLVHPESVGRVAKFHEWLPNIVTDHHEMGANSTFFFQPGVQTRNNPITPGKNYELTHKIAEYHASYLDDIGADYYSEEQFDDYYLGKGSSYPDVNSGIGILFEQAGFRGKIRETSNGSRKLAYGIRNQFTVTLSTLEAARNMKNELLDHQKQFYREAFQLAEKDPVKAYIFGNRNNKLQAFQFVKLLQQHRIEVYTSTKEIDAAGKRFEPGNSYVVPLKQRQYRMVKALFDEVTTFSDTVFYDVSTWNMPHTFNVAYAGLGSLKEVHYSEQPVALQAEGKITGGQSKTGYLFRWHEYIAPRALYILQKAGLLTKVATSGFGFTINGKEEEFACGTIYIPVTDQPLAENRIYQLIEKVAKETGIDFYGLSTGLSPKGIDLGSGYMVTVEQPKMVMFTGGSTSSAGAGEIWHLFDQRYEIPVTLTETSSLSSMELSEYNTIILPGGSYREWNTADVQKIKNWVQSGGTLIAMQSAASWAARNELGKTTYKKAAETDSTLNFSYADREKERRIHSISGAILNTMPDITHPLCYGYTGNSLPVFKTGNSVAKPLNVKYAEPVKFASQPLLSGFVSDKNLELIKNAPVVSVQSIGKGKIISYHESMTFRGIWLGTNKLLANGVFFGKVIQ